MTATPTLGVISTTSTGSRPQVIRPSLAESRDANSETERRSHMHFHRFTPASQVVPPKWPLRLTRSGILPVRSSSCFPEDALCCAISFLGQSCPGSTPGSAECDALLAEFPSLSDLSLDDLLSALSNGVCATSTSSTTSEPTQGSTLPSSPTSSSSQTHLSSSTSPSNQTPSSVPSTASLIALPSLLSTPSTISAPNPASISSPVSSEPTSTPTTTSLDPTTTLTTTSISQSTRTRIPFTTTSVSSTRSVTSMPKLTPTQKPSSSVHSTTTSMSKTSQPYMSSDVPSTSESPITSLTAGLSANTSTRPLILPPSLSFQTTGIISVTSLVTPSTVPSTISMVPTSPDPTTSSLTPSPPSSQRTTSLIERTAVKAGIGGGVGGLALVALLVLFLWCRRRRRQASIVTPYSYSTVPGSPGFSSTEFSAQVKMSLHQSNVPRPTSITYPTHRSDSEIAVVDEPDNITLCVPEDRSAVARRERERELEKLYPYPLRQRAREVSGEVQTVVETKSEVTLSSSPQDTVIAV